MTQILPQPLATKCFFLKQKNVIYYLAAACHMFLNALDVSRLSDPSGVEKVAQSRQAVRFDDTKVRHVSKGRGLQERF